MNTTRNELHQLVDMIDMSEAELIYRLLLKFIPEDEPSADEVEAILKARNDEYIPADKIDWNAPNVE